VNCKDFKQYVTPYIDKELQCSMEGEFKEYLENCEECRKEYISLEAVNSKLDQLFTEKRCLWAWRHELLITFLRRSVDLVLRRYSL
jgi:anti-sigma factor RsiW